jgi:hypothetical protein
MRYKVTAVTYLLYTSVSLTPLCMSQQCQWHHCAMCCVAESYFRRKNSVSGHSRRYSTKLVAQRCWCFFCRNMTRLHSAHDTAVTFTAVSLTPLWQAQWCHWNRCATNFVEYLREFEAIFEKAWTCVSGVQGKLFDEKNRSRKSRVRVPLNFNENATGFSNEKFSGWLLYSNNETKMSSKKFNFLLYTCKVRDFHNTVVSLIAYSYTVDLCWRTLLQFWSKLPFKAKIS